MSTLDVVLPIIESTYGRGSMPKALAEHLAEKIDAHSPSERYHYSRETMIRDTCWNWFSGGSTAEHVAERIEAALWNASAS